MPAEVCATFVTAPCSWLPLDRVAAGVASSLHCAMTRLPGYPVELNDGTKLPSISIDLGRTKTSDGSREEIVFLTGAPVDALDAWLAAAKIQKGGVFRAIDQWGNISRRAIDAQSINAIVKQRAESAGLEPSDYSAHGLRSGFLTEAALRNVSLLEAMDQSRHRSMQQAGSYYNDGRRKTGLAARLL